MIFFLSLLSALSLLYPAHSFAQTVDVVFLTPEGPRVLHSWSPDEISHLGSANGKHGSDLSSQKFIFDESTKSMELTKRADIDLVTIYGDKQIARVPRFMIWRGFLKLKWDAQSKTLNSFASASSMSRLLVPAAAFQISGIRKIELSQHYSVYPGTALKIRTNPAASRGEKLFTQSCLACHSLPTFKALKPEDLTASGLGQFRATHKTYSSFDLDAKAVRGLLAYSSALASEKNEVKSKK